MDVVSLASLYVSAASPDHKGVRGDGSCDASTLFTSKICAYPCVSTPATRVRLASSGCVTKWTNGEMPRVIFWVDSGSLTVGISSEVAVGDESGALGSTARLGASSAVLDISVSFVGHSGFASCSLKPPARVPHKARIPCVAPHVATAVMSSLSSQRTLGPA